MEFRIHIKTKTFELIISMGPIILTVAAVKIWTITFGVLGGL